MPERRAPGCCGRPPRNNRIERPQLSGEGFEPLRAESRRQFAAQVFIGLRQVVHAFAQRLDIKPRAPDGNDAVMPGEQSFEAGEGLRFVLAATQVIREVVRCYKMVFDGLQLVAVG